MARSIQIIKLVFGQQLELFYRFAQQPCGNAVGGSHYLRMFIQHPGKHLDIAQYHHGQQLTVFGTLVFLLQRGCRDGEQRRDGGADDNHANLFPKILPGIHVDLGGSDNIDFGHNLVNSLSHKSKYIVNPGVEPEVVAERGVEAAGKLEGNDEVLVPCQLETQTRSGGKVLGFALQHAFFRAEGSGLTVEAIGLGDEAAVEEGVYRNIKILFQ